jgi:hypothetical protein
MLLMESLLESTWKFRRECSLWNPYWNPYGTFFGDGSLIDFFFLLIFASPSMESVNIHTNFSYEIPQSSGVDPHRNRRVLHMDSIPESIWNIFVGVTPNFVSPILVSPNIISPSHVSPNLISPNLISPSKVSSNLISLSHVSLSHVHPNLIFPS